MPDTDADADTDTDTDADTDAEQADAAAAREAEVAVFRQRRQRFWLMFAERNGMADGVPFFSERGLEVRSVDVDDPPRTCLARSNAMEAMLREQAETVFNDASAGGHVTDGLLSCLYVQGPEGPEPLQIGAISKWDSQGRFSRQLRDLVGGRGMRAGAFGYAKTGFLAGISSQVFRPDADQPHRLSKYGEWADRLFARPFSEHRLREQVYFWVKAWDPSQRGPWLDFGPTGLASLRAQLLAVAVDAYPGRLVGSPAPAAKT